MESRKLVRRPKRGGLMDTSSKKKSRASRHQMEPLFGIGLICVDKHCQPHPVQRS